MACASRLFVRRTQMTISGAYVLFIILAKLMATEFKGFTDIAASAFCFVCLMTLHRSATITATYANFSSGYVGGMSFPCATMQSSHTVAARYQTSWCKQRFQRPQKLAFPLPWPPTVHYTCSPSHAYESLNCIFQVTLSPATGTSLSPSGGNFITQVT